jgi:hypothetical protein
MSRFRFWLYRTFRYNRIIYRMLGCSHPVLQESSDWGCTTFCSRCGSTRVPQMTGARR